MNKTFLIGNVCAEPELSELSSGTKVCRFSLAVNRPYVSADGERKTDFFNIIAWRTLAETASNYLHKGDKVAVTGSIEIKNYEDSKGNKRTSVEIVAQDLEFLNQRNNPTDTTTGVRTQNTQSNGYSNGKSKQATLLEEFDSGDIPF